VFRIDDARRMALALGLVLGASLLAQPSAAELGRQDPAHCVGQKELKPLKPLVLHTAKGAQRFMVEVADTPMRREYGLMCRKSLAADRGMLFDFKTPEPDSAFWMRNTLIPLDIIYIRPDGRVRSIARNAKPLDESPIPAGGEVLWVLELAGGRAEQVGLLPGDLVDYGRKRRG
jgi:uncharacterized membrane protein (UPF0127 family)